MWIQLHSDPEEAPGRHAQIQEVWGVSLRGPDGESPSGFMELLANLLHHFIEDFCQFWAGSISLGALPRKKLVAFGILPTLSARQQSQPGVNSKSGTDLLTKATESAKFFDKIDQVWNDDPVRALLVLSGRCICVFLVCSDGNLVVALVFCDTGGRAR